MRALHALSMRWDIPFSFQFYTRIGEMWPSNNRVGLLVEVQIAEKVATGMLFPGLRKVNSESGYDE